MTWCDRKNTGLSFEHLGFESNSSLLALHYFLATGFWEKGVDFLGLKFFSSIKWMGMVSASQIFMYI